MMALTLALAIAGAPELPGRMVTLGAAVTETVAALGGADSIVAVDTTSRFPPELSDRPRIGYLRTLPAEGLLASRPNLVIGSEAAGPPPALDALRSAGVRVVLVPEATTWAEGRARLVAVGRAIGRESEARALAATVDARLDGLEKTLAGRRRPRVAFVFSHGRTAVVAGADTVADEMLRLSGAQNAFASLTGFKEPTSESVVLAAPEIVVTTPRVLEGLGGRAGLAALPGFASTPAVNAGKLVLIDDILFLALGPRTAEAAEQLASELHPEASKG